MRYYEIQLPARTNAGILTTGAIAQFEREALSACGGYSRGPSLNGAWQGDKVYHDTMVPFRLACTEKQFAGLLLTAFRLFPDQEAIFTADLGTASIHERPKVHSVAA